MCGVTRSRHEETRRSGSLHVSARCARCAFAWCGCTSRRRELPFRRRARCIWAWRQAWLPRRCGAIPAQSSASSCCWTCVPPPLARVGTCILSRMGSCNFDFMGPSCAILRIHGPLAQWWSRGLIILWLSVRVRQGPPEKFQLRSVFRFWAGFVFSGFCSLVSHLAATNRPPCSPLAAPLAFFRIALVLLDAYQFARFRRRTQLTTVTAACDDGRASEMRKQNACLRHVDTTSMVKSHIARR